MKGMKKALIGLALGAVAALGVVGFAACDSVITGEAEGEYHYANPWDSKSPDYGVKVKVVVEEDIIQSVTIVESDYVQASATWTDRDNYLAQEAELLSRYKGVDVDDVMKIKVGVSTDPKGQPITQDEDGFVALKAGKTDLLLGDATQSSARIVLAVQNAIENIEAAQAEAE